MYRNKRPLGIYARYKCHNMYVVANNSEERLRVALDYE